MQRAYWDLVFALRNLQVQRDAVRDSRTQLEHNKRLVAEGALAPIDVVAAEAQVAGFEQTLFTALEEVSRSENNLKNLIAENRQAGLWSVSLIPTDSVDLAPPNVSLPEALKAAMDNRPELQQSNVVREINQIDQKYFREQTKPPIDLVGSYGMVGLAGAINTGAINPFSSTAQIRDRVNQLSELAGVPPLPVATPADISSRPDWRLRPVAAKSVRQSFQQFSRRRADQFALRNRTAEAQLGRSLVEGQRIATQREQLEQTIQVEVRNALQVVRSAEARLRAARRHARQASSSIRVSKENSMPDNRRCFWCWSGKRL